MTSQIVIFALLIVALALFLWGRWRHDIVAMMVLLAAVILGSVPVSEAFSGFGHPAVITVAAVLVISRAIERSGVLHLSARKIAKIRKFPVLSIFILTALGAIMSGFMNNVGALALLMPLALRVHKSPSMILMPLSFGTLLGGMMTEIGTPPNIIIASYKESVAGHGFGLFDFTPVGSVITVVGILFLTTLGLKLLPSNRKAQSNPNEIVEGADYITEVSLPEMSSAIGRTPRQLERMMDNEILVLGIVRGERKLLGHLRNAVLQTSDILIIRADAPVLQRMVETVPVELVGERHVDSDDLGSEQVELMETVVRPGARLERRTARTVMLHARYGVNLLGIARQGERITERLGAVEFRAGDVLLVQGERETLNEIMVSFGCMPLATRGLERALRLPKFLTPIIFGGAILSTSFGLLPVEISFTAAAVLLILTGVLTPRAAYNTIDWSVIVLLAALIPVGHALETSGADTTIATFISGMAGEIPPWGILATLMAVTMVLTNLINNAATAVVMAPIAVGIAHQTGVSIDPFLMVVAIGASSAFLTPIGHQNNVLVMGPGGYKFGDFWRLGLPLQIIILVISIPAILMIWPL